MFNNHIRGWINYYGRFYKSALYPALRHIDRILARWVHRKFKSLRRHKRRTHHWLAHVVRRQPDLFASLEPSVWARPNNGSRMRREPHVRFCERAAVKLRRATHLVITISGHWSKRGWAERALQRTLRVELNREKTKMVDTLKGEAFGFLGFDLRRVHKRKNGTDTHHPERGAPPPWR